MVGEGEGVGEGVVSVGGGGGLRSAALGGGGFLVAIVVVTGRECVYGGRCVYRTMLGPEDSSEG